VTELVSGAPEPILDLQQVRMRFASGPDVLKGVTLAVPAGQFCVLLGASGAGKSTLLRIINGLLQPASGEVFVAGRSLAQSPLRRRRIGTIHQGADLVPRLSVLDNVLCGSLGQISTVRALLGLFGNERARLACRLLSRVGLEETHLYRRASDLSGGQKQRVGVARAFMSTPRLILADEPVASLDPRTSRSILTLLSEAAREHEAAVLCSLHDVDLAREFADRIVGMRDGRITFDCRPHDLTSPLIDELYAAA
jgi:phosphonate transport system ATP-binding protein